MRFQPFSLAVVACAAGLSLAGCKSPATPARYLGTTKDADWPYRYRLAQTGGVWAGTIEHRDTGGWEFWDAMDITGQNKSRIKFKARVGDAPSFRLGWYLKLENVSPQGFSGMLVGDIFGSRAIELSFAPSVSEPDRAANRRPAGQSAFAALRRDESDGSDNLAAPTSDVGVAADRAFPAAVAELGR